MTEPDATLSEVPDSTPTEFNTSAAPSAKRGLLARLRRGKKPVEVAVTPREEGSVLQLKKGYNEIVETMASVRMHMEQQSARSEQMLEILQQLPATLKHSADASQAQTRVLETIHHSLVGQNETQNELSKALTGLAGATQEQEQAVVGIRQELSAQREQARETMSGISETLSDVTTASQANAKALSAVASRAETSDLKTIEIFEKYRRNAMFSNAFTFAAASLVALLGVFMMLELKDRNAITGVPETDESVLTDPTTDPNGTPIELANEAQNPIDDSVATNDLAADTNADTTANLIPNATPGAVIEDSAVNEAATPTITPASDESLADEAAAEATDATDALVTDAAALDDAAADIGETANQTTRDAAEAVTEVPENGETTGNTAVKPAEDAEPNRALPDTFGAPAENVPARAEEDSNVADGAILGS